QRKSRTCIYGRMPPCVDGAKRCIQHRSAIHPATEVAGFLAESPMKKTLLRIALAGLGVTLLAPHPAAATEQDEVMKIVRQWVESLNKGDTKTAIAACAEQTSIVDEFPPHEWHGDGACARWVTELDAYNQKLGLTNSIVTLK